MKLEIEPQFDWSQDDDFVRVNVWIGSADQDSTVVMISPNVLRVTSLPYRLELQLYGEIEESLSSYVYREMGITFALAKVRLPLRILRTTLSFWTNFDGLTSRHIVKAVKPSTVLNYTGNFQEGQVNAYVDAKTQCKQVSLHKKGEERDLLDGREILEADVNDTFFVTAKLPARALGSDSLISSSVIASL
jgi:hypothetical protein